MSDRSRLWNRDFTVLWIGLLQSYFGDAFLAIGIMWMVLQITGSPLAAGTVLILEELPKLLGPVAGAIVDRSSKRTLMIGGDLIRGVCLVSLYALHAAGLLAVWHVYAAVIVLGLCAIFYSPSLRVILPSLVPQASLTAANSILQGSEQLAMVAGAALAGLALAAFGAPMALLIDGVTFLLAAVAVWLVRFPAEALSENRLAVRQIVRDLGDGFRYILDSSSVLGLTAVVFVSNLILSPVNVIFPVYSRDVLQQGVDGFGFLASSLAVGYLLGSVAAGTLRIGLAWAILWGLTGMTVALMSFSWVSSLGPAIFIAGLLGLFVPLVQVPLVTYLQSSVPREYQGRVFATMGSLVALAVPLGAALFGQALSVASVPLVFRGAGVGILIVAVTWGAIALRKRSVVLQPVSASAQE